MTPSWKTGDDQHQRTCCMIAPTGEQVTLVALLKAQLP
jgi:hypothetical protein